MKLTLEAVRQGELLVISKLMLDEHNLLDKSERIVAFPKKANLNNLTRKECHE